MAKILLAEDEVNIASFIERGLKEFGHSVTVCHDGNTGWRILQEEPFDLVILDIIMPKINGLELCHLYRQMFGYQAPVIMLTALGTTEDIVKGLDAGADDYLVKPFQFPRFRQALDRFLQARRLLEQGPGSMDQSAIDQLVHHREAVPPGTPLDKGVNFSTLSRIRRFFDENPEHFFTSEQIAEHVGLSRITVRRYVNYMVDQGEITSSIDYQTGGRPSIRYLRLHS